MVPIPNQEVGLIMVSITVQIRLIPRPFVRGKMSQHEYNITAIVCIYTSIEHVIVPAVLLVKTTTCTLLQVQQQGHSQSSPNKSHIQNAYASVNQDGMSTTMVFQHVT